MMKNDLYPCLWFNGQAKEAANFYASAFDNSKITAENPMVMMFELDGMKFMGLNGGPQFNINPSISFFAYCEGEEELEKIWNLLSEGGKVLMPLDKYPWSEMYGWCQDKFGVNWQLMKGENEQRIVPSLMFTQDNSGRAQEAIDFYTSLFDDSAINMVSKYEKGEGDTEGFIKHAQFTINGQRFAAMDSSGPHKFTFNEGLSIVVPCETQEQIDYFWQKLSEGGLTSQCGWLKDKFGVSWQIVPIILGKLMSNPDKRQKVMDVVMKSKKFDIAELENA